jgi:GT2 family glycosyltransferase/glycosyltransferase involved in cell wall biosynthesis
MHRSSVIIPAFNRVSLTQDCLQTILGRDGCDVIVVDDASFDSTPQLLAGFGSKITVVTHAVNGGFALSCNDGAKAARSDYLIFLNNDTIPQPGWLQTLVQYADDHPQAAVVGAKLLYPDNTVQHAGVVICQDRYPRHIYSGFPADHPAVNKSRRFQIVTGACMLIRREVFEQVGGFDTSFRNGFEDVDLCLRIGETGREIHYCARSVVQHLESVSPGRFKSDGSNVALYRDRWIHRVDPDDLHYYLEDDLLRLTYEGHYPLRIEISPLLATTGDAARDLLGELFRKRTRQATELRAENTRLRIQLGENAANSPELNYLALRDRFRWTVPRLLPAQATVLVVSKGDSSLLDLPGLRTWHFPQTEHGVYAGHHPLDSQEAINHLEALRAKGADYLVFPATAHWWLDYYTGFKEHLETQYRVLARQDETFLIFSLQESTPRRARRSHSEGRPRKRKILFVCHNHPAQAPGGAEIYALELYQAMRSSETFEPILLARTDSTYHIAPSGNDRNQHFFYTKTSDYDFFYMTLRNRGFYSQAWREFLVTHQPSIIHFQHTHFLGYDFIRQARETLPDAAIVYTLHEYLPICHRNGQMLRTGNEERCRESSPQRCHECFPQISPQAFLSRRHLIQSQFAFVDMFIAPSRFLMERYVEWGIPREKIRCEDYGRLALSPTNGLDEERPRNRFGYFGQLNPFKGVNVLLKAMSNLGQTDLADPHLWIHGSNLRLQNDDFQREFQILLKEASPKVTFAGNYKQADLPRLMASIDWVVVPSIWWENSPLVIQEAFGHRRPVICSDIGGMAEKVHHGINGLHFRAGDPWSLAQTIRQAIETPNLWRTFGRGIPEVYPMNKHTAVLNSLYEALLDVKASGRKR